MPYFGWHYVGAYSVNPYGIRRDSAAPSRGRMDSRTTSATGLVSSRGSRLFGKVALHRRRAGHCVGTSPLGSPITTWPWLDESASANFATASSTLHSTTALARDRRAIRASISYPWRPASRPRTDFDAEFGHIEGRLGGQPREECRDVQPEPAARFTEAAVPLPRSRPVRASLQALRVDPPAGAVGRPHLFESGSQASDLVPMSSGWRR